MGTKRAGHVGTAGGVGPVGSEGADRVTPDVLGYRIADPASVTQMLGEIESGAAGAWDRVYALLYAELRQIASSLIRQKYRGFAISPTSLVSETWLKLAGAELSANDRSHLVVLIVRAMRFVLVDHVRRVNTEKRGDGLQVLSLDDSHDVGEDSRFEQLLILDKALSALAEVDPRMAKVVEMRYFGGMSLEEIAGTLDVTERTVGRDWRRARAFLLSTLADDEVALPP